MRGYGVMSNLKAPHSIHTTILALATDI